MDTTFPSYESAGSSPIPDPNTVWMRISTKELSLVIKDEAIVVPSNLFAQFDYLESLPGMGVYLLSQYNPNIGLSEASFRVYELSSSSPVSTFVTSATCTGCGGRRNSWTDTCRRCLSTILRYRLTHPRSGAYLY